MSFTAAQIAYLDANYAVVEARRLFEIAFDDEVFRLAESEVPITANSAVWQPAVQIISAPSVIKTNDFEAVPGEYIISALPVNAETDMAAAYQTMKLTVLHSKSSWFGRPVTQYLQLMANGVPVGDAFALTKGWIRGVTIRESATEAFFKIRVEGLLERRNRTPLGEYTDRDQQRRHPGDKGCEFAPSLVDKTVTGWPF